MTRSFDLNLLPVLVTVYEHGSVTAAAEHLGMSQSAISTALAKLRLTYGDPLFHRVGHGMQPTARMRGLIEPVREALSRVDGTFTSEPVFNAGTTAHTFTLALSDLGEMVFMPKILRRIRQLAPRASVRRSEEHTSELQSHVNLVCRLLLEKKKSKIKKYN